LEKEILLTNDDGIYSQGLYALYREMKKLGKVTIVAPDTEKSAVGHAITLSSPLRFWEIKRNGRVFGYAVNGTPADCVKIAVKVIMKRKPDIVISGINRGPNTAMNVIYSGTVSAATEASILGIYSFAVSLTSREYDDFSASACFSKKLAKKIFRYGLPEGTFLNVNIPPGKKEDIKGVKITSQGKGRFIEEFEKRVDPSKRSYYWLKGDRLEIDEDENVDEVAIKNGKISITPIHYDMTNYSVIELFKNWNLTI